MVPLSTTGQIRILGVGSLIPLKRWDRLLKVAVTLKERNFDFLVQIVGAGPLRETLEKQKEEMGMGNHVQFLGHSDEIPHLLSDATFLVHTSDTEGCPNAVLEAMACGRAVVATDAGDVPSIVEDGQTGFVVKRGDDATLVERVAMLIKDRELCRKMGEAGRVKAEREFGLDRLVSETLAAYRAAGWRDS
jgi:glycosyltransferase involved in cell wall biosynthesis